MPVQRHPGEGWLVLLGGGEFSFGETHASDELWTGLLADRESPEVGFLPTASGSTEYGDHLAEYLDAEFSLPCQTIPIYRPRDARRAKNLDRIAACGAIYLGAGVTDHLLGALQDEPAIETLGQTLANGGVVVAIGAAAQVFGVAARSLLERTGVPGFGWLAGGVVEPNFDPGHDRRLRELLEWPGVGWGLGLPAGSAVALGPQGEVRRVGPAFLVEGADGDIEWWPATESGNESATSSPDGELQNNEEE